MFYPADDRYRAQDRVSCRNRIHTVFKVPYARSAYRPKEATEVASHEQVYHKPAFFAKESSKTRFIPPRKAVGFRASIL
jgi:hypothetical protein